MKKAFNIITLTAFALSIMLGIPAPVLARQCKCPDGEGLRIIQPSGLTQATADGRYWNIAGDTASGGAHDFSPGTLLAAIASAANEVMTQGASDARYAELAGDTFTGVVLYPDGVSALFPPIAFASEPGTGMLLTKAGRIAFAIEGTGSVLTVDAVGVVMDGNLSVGGGTITLPVLTTFIASDDIVYDATGFQHLFKGVHVRIEGTGGLSIDPGSPINATIFKVASVGGSPECFWNEILDKFECTKNFILPDGPPLTVMFGGGTNAPQFNTQNATWTTAGIFLFGGTTARGTPSKIKAVGFKDAGPTSWDIQVLDITNTTTIVTKTGNTGTTPEIVDLGALSNLPAVEAMLEVQIKRAGGLPADFVFVHSITIEF